MGAFTASGVLSPVCGAASSRSEWRHTATSNTGVSSDVADSAAALEPRPEPTLDDVRCGYETSPVNEEEEVTDLVGLCLWDVCSDNHEVIAADGRVADIGSFRGAGRFLDEYLTRDQDGWREGDYMRSTWERSGSIDART
jgi:hypothetical protein